MSTDDRLSQIGHEIVLKRDLHEYDRWSVLFESEVEEGQPCKVDYLRVQHWIVPADATAVIVTLRFLKKEAGDEGE